jgi:hypothetical protein
MSKSQFLDKSNVATLWEVISDEELFKSHTADVKNAILQLFSDNIKSFFNSESKNNKITLIEMNKKYILTILNFIKTYYPVPTLQKIVIKEEIQPTQKEIITIEERKQERLSDFDAKLHLVEEEFKNAISRPIPETPNFSDNIKEQTIKEMEKAIQEITEQRNYEIQQITKQQLPPPPQKQNNKHITWADEQKKDNITLSFEEQTADIFSKLKPKLKMSNSEIERNQIDKLEDDLNILKNDITDIKNTISKILTILSK